MRFAILMTGWLILGGVVASAEDVYVLHECRAFCTKTTEVDRLRLPDLPLKGDDANKFGAGLELKVEWLTAKDFKDEQGRTWYLYRGKAPEATGEKVAGWLVKSELGREYYYTKDSLLFGREAAVPIHMPCPTKVTNVAPKAK